MTKRKVSLEKLNELIYSVASGFCFNCPLFETKHCKSNGLIANCTTNIQDWIELEENTE